LIPYFAITLFAGVRPGLNGELAKLAEHPELVSLEKQVDSNNGGLSPHRPLHRSRVPLLKNLFKIEAFLKKRRSHQKALGCA
jgi:hypothetical protein